MFKWAAIVAAVLGVGLAISVDRLIDARAELKIARVANAKLDGQLTALQERYSRAAAVRQVGEQYKIEVQNVANKTEWGAHVVPGDVANELCKRAKCATRDSLPASGDRSDK